MVIIGRGHRVDRRMKGFRDLLSELRQYGHDDEPIARNRYIVYVIVYTLTLKSDVLIAEAVSLSVRLI